jgi:hypothetical protein
MYTTDFDRFRVALETHGECFGKPVTDKIASAYWEALKDQHIAAFERASANHLRYGKFFPKPSELRPKGEKAPEPQDEKAINAANSASTEGWDALRRDNPRRFWKLFASAYMARLEFRFPPESAEYREAARACLTRCRDELRALGDETKIMDCAHSPTAAF